jgi:cytochrome c556
MFSRLLVVIAVLWCGVSFAAAQSCQDPIDARQTLMKKSGAMAKVGSAMIKGETPFDLAKTKEIFAAFADDAAQMPKLFPDCSKTGEHSTAAATIWDRPNDFAAAIAKFAADVMAAQESTKDVETLKASFQSVGKNCSGCHETFRVKRS